MDRTKRLARLDKKYIWHPFTQMREWTADSMVIIESGKGSYLVDTGGKKYLDGVSSIWCNVHGHGVPEIDRAVRRQLASIAHSTFLGLSNEPAIRLSQELIEMAPRGLSKVFYSDSGSEAVEIALKMSFQYWQHRGKRKKRRFLHFVNAYHGDTIGSVSVGGIDLFHRIFKPLLFRSIVAPAPDRFHERFQGSEEAYARVCSRRVEKILRRHREEIAAMVLEPVIQGAAGMITHPAGFLKEMRRLADRYGVLLVLDEVATGFGRTGRMFACEHEGVSPDILCLAKGLTAGYLPLAATLTKEKIYQAFLGEYEEFKTFFHGHTYTANPLACAAALANLNYFRRHAVLKKSKRQILHLSRQLENFWDLRHVGDIRQAGMMVGIELVEDRLRRRSFPLERKIGMRVSEGARKRGVIIRPLGNVIVLMPSFSFTFDQMTRLCRAVYESIDEIAP